MEKYHTVANEEVNTEICRTTKGTDNRIHFEVLIDGKWNSYAYWSEEYGIGEAYISTDQDIFNSYEEFKEYVKKHSNIEID